MTIVIVSTSIRHVPVDEPSGFLYSIDLRRKQVLKKTTILEPAFRRFDNNPRGGMRGSKGISFHDGQVALTNYSNIFRYGSNWELLGVVSHPSCAGIHDILMDEGSIWVTSSRSDLFLQLDFQSKLRDFLYVRELSVVRDQMGWKAPILLNHQDIICGKTDFRDPRTHELEKYDRAHVNALCQFPNGDKLISLGFVTSWGHMNLLRLKVGLAKVNIWPIVKRVNKSIKRFQRNEENKNTDLVVQPAKGQSVVLKISEMKSASIVLVLKDLTVPSHSLLALDEKTAIYLNTTEGKVLLFDPYSGDFINENKVTDGFLRGVTRLGQKQLVMGSNGNLIVYNLTTQMVDEIISFTRNPKESVYDVKVLPDSFSLPPDSLNPN